MKSFKIIISLLIVTIALSGCLNLNTNNSIAFSFNAWFNDVEGEFLYFPVMVNSTNKTVFTMNEYYFKEGKGDIEYIQIGKVTMLNISSTTQNIEIKLEQKEALKEEQNLTFSNSYVNQTDGYNYTKIYYSGDNRVYMSAGYVIIKGNIEISYFIGPYYLSHGWNHLRIKFGGSISD